tara:strand:+ start:101 stop:547 length:447 start_codon:yes stop_codon:yes gene_type:complete
MRSIQGLRSFKDTLPLKVRGIIKKKGRIYSELLDNWRHIVGNDLFKICYPKSFKSENKFRGSLLEIMVKRGHEVDMEYSKKVIIQKVNSYFDQIVLNNIKLITFEGDNEKFKSKPKKNVTKSEYTKKISNIKNEKIKNSLLAMSKYFK